MVHIAAFLASGLIALVSARTAHERHAALHRRGGYGAPPAPPTYASFPPQPECKTWTTTWYGPSGLVPCTSTPAAVTPTSYATTSSTSTECTSTSTPPPPPPTYSKPAPAPSYSKPAPPPPAYSKPATPTTSPSPSKVPSYGGSSSSSGGQAANAPNGNKWAMTYTPYDTTGACKTASQVMSDIASIKSMGFTAVRLYSTDCNGVENIGAACNQQNLNMLMGIYIDSSGVGAAYSQADELIAWGKANGWGKVEMLIAGNEAVFNGYTTASELAGFISSVRSQFRAAGFTGPVTTTEPLNIIQENGPTFCGAVDVIAGNLHPFYNAATPASAAGTFVVTELSALSQVCNGEKEAYNLETGWPSQGLANGLAVPGASEQAEAVNNIVSSAGSKSAIFAFQNNLWEAPGAFDVDQYWGCAQLFSQ